MVEIIDAIYENGIFKPLKVLHMKSGQKVKLIVETGEEESVYDILKLATDDYDCLSDEDSVGIEKITIDPRNFINNECE